MSRSNITVEKVEYIAEGRALSAEMQSLSATIQLIKYHHDKVLEELQSKMNRSELELSDLIEKRDDNV